VREKFRRIKPLEELSLNQRGWTLDVLNIVRRITSQSGIFSSPSPRPSPPGEGGAIGRRKSSFNSGAHSETRGTTFSNSDIYAYERELEALHPDNRHIRDKIRQQLQVLRDTGFLMQPERGVWRVKNF
jgi:hypothetical protein